MASVLEATLPATGRPLPAPRRGPASLFDRYAMPCLAFAAFSATLLGAKLWLISTYGNATPYWDQWDGEAATLYKPLLDGTLGWGNLLAPHNEHRIFTMRLIELALLMLNGIWNPLLEMVVNAVIHTLALALGAALLARVVGRSYLPALLLFTLALFAIPFAWENTLGGFHACHYLVFLFSVASLWLTVTESPLSAGWWAGAACAVLAFLSLASGVCAPAAAAVVSLGFYATGLRRNRKQLLAIAILAGLSALGVALTPSLPLHASLGSASLSQFLDAGITVLGWPVSSNVRGALVRNAPALVFAGIMLWKLPPAGDRRWYLLSLVVWTLGQTVMFAYGRAYQVICPRYIDSFAVGILVNFACLISIAQAQFGKRHGWTIAGVSAWVTIILYWSVMYAGQHLPAELAVKRAIGLAQEINTRNYVATGDIHHLQDKPYLNVPHPSPERLAAILAVPEIRAILPANIRAPLEPAAADALASKRSMAWLAIGTPSASGKGRLDALARHALAHYHLFLAVGFAAAVVLAAHYGLNKCQSQPAAVELPAVRLDGTGLRC